MSSKNIKYVFALTQIALKRCEAKKLNFKYYWVGRVLNWSQKAQQKNLLVSENNGEPKLQDDETFTTHLTLFLLGFFR